MKQSMFMSHDLVNNPLHLVSVAGHIVVHNRAVIIPYAIKLQWQREGARPSHALFEHMQLL